MDEPVRYIRVGDFGDDFFEIVWLLAYADVRQDSAWYRGAQTIVVADEVRQVEGRRPIVVGVGDDDGGAADKMLLEHFVVVRV